MRRRVEAWVLGLALLLGALITVLTVAPARWLDFAIDQASGGRVRIAQAQGTIWHGSGQLVLSAAPESAAVLKGYALPAAVALRGMALPGRLAWQFDWTQWWRATLVLQARHPALAAPLVVKVALPGAAGLASLLGRLGASTSGAADDGDVLVDLGQGELALPNMNLGELGSPWNALQPGGRFQLRWRQLQLVRDGMRGEFSVVAAEVTSVVTPVRPLGSYQLRMLGQGRGVDVQLSSLKGALRLQASGRLEQGFLRLNGEASCSEQCDDLTPLLAMIGRFDGKVYRFRMG